jgi:hypothetical protein
MKATISTTHSFFAASRSRDNEWKQCCAYAMGFEWVDRFDTTTTHQHGNNNNDDDDDVNTNYLPIQQIINLLDDATKVDNNIDHDDDDEFVDDYYSVCNDSNNNSSNKNNVRGHDAWMNSAIRIQTDLNRMVQFIHSKHSDYIGLNTMVEEEASLIQSTVTSFTATTATDLETLREMIVSTTSSSSSTGTGTRKNNHNNTNLASHRSGIVQILLGQLQEEVAKPFSIMQKQRTRMAVQLWQNPLQCKLYQPPPPKLTTKRKIKDHTNKNNKMDLTFDDLLDDDDGERNNKKQREQRFLPRRQQQQQQQQAQASDDFISKYANKSQSTIPPSSPPNFVTQLMMMNSKRQRFSSSSSSRNSSSNTFDVGGPQEHTTTTVTNKQQQTRTRTRMDGPSKNSSHLNPITTHYSNLNDDVDDQNNVSANDYYEQLQDDMNAEAIQLTTTLVATSDLDSVQQMETRMVQITTLIGQFSNLVQEQQEQVLQVHESAKTTKDNMDRGQENLIDAADRTKRSKNYKAWIIVTMALLLLFFHTVMR